MQVWTSRTATCGRQCCSLKQEFDVEQVLQKLLLIIEVTLPLMYIHRTVAFLSNRGFT